MVGGERKRLCETFSCNQRKTDTGNSETYGSVKGTSLGNSKALNTAGPKLGLKKKELKASTCVRS